MGAIVYAPIAEHAKVYHFDKGCPNFSSAQLLNDWDCGCDIYCTHRTPRLHALKRMSDEHATVDRRLWPCLYCVPPHLRKFPPSETFGHEPMTVNVGMCGGCDTCGDYCETDVCARCHVEWPCMSAIVLGLVPREARP